MERTRKRENRRRWEETVEVATVEVATVEVAREGQLAGGTSLGFCLRHCSTESVTVIVQPRFL